MNDLQFAFRQLAKQPAFSLVAITALGLGVGASTATFSVVNAVLLRPLFYKAPERCNATPGTNRGNQSLVRRMRRTSAIPSGFFCAE